MEDAIPRAGDVPFEALATLDRTVVTGIGEVTNAARVAVIGRLTEGRGADYVFDTGRHNPQPFRRRLSPCAKAAQSC